MRNKRDKGPAKDQQAIGGDLVKLDFGRRFMDLHSIAAAADAGAPRSRKLPPKPGRAPLPDSPPSEVLNSGQRHKDHES